jgi:hypothetical protein
LVDVGLGEKKLGNDVSTARIKSVKKMLVYRDFVGLYPKRCAKPGSISDIVLSSFSAPYGAEV